MAESPSHKFGQIIGHLLEEILLPALQSFCDERKLYLDKKGIRGKARAGRKVTWKDKYGNAHDLDFVIEKGGSTNTLGVPLAFIEAAWRRYTKHSKNKVQEIQGALLPIAELYYSDKPFLGAILAGEFTAPSLEQLRSLGFEILYFPYGSIISAFADVGINVAFDEDTPDILFEECIEKIQKLPTAEGQSLKDNLVRLNQTSIEKFFVRLRISLDRAIEYIVIIPLFGEQHKFSSTSAAGNFLQTLNTLTVSGSFQRFEVVVKYSNNDVINASIPG